MDKSFVEKAEIYIQKHRLSDAYAFIFLKIVNLYKRKFSFLNLEIKELHEICDQVYYGKNLVSFNEKVIDMKTKLKVTDCMFCGRQHPTTVHYNFLVEVSKLSRKIEWDNLLWL